MSKKIDIREIHTNFEHLLFERDALISTDLNSTKIDELDNQLLDVIISGIYSGVAFSERMNSWKPHSTVMSQSLENDTTIDGEEGKITVNQALSLKIEKERKFKEVQNLSMLSCTILLGLYYMIVGWWG
ncbi:MAG: hypothetical protein H8E72_06175 [Candidatus Marinimicrobia bacterium]|nr:hypothetical protein [Candidatus Neomarinimicrobiota bacterium]